MKKLWLAMALALVLLSSNAVAECGETHAYVYVPVSAYDCIAVCEFCGYETNAYPTHYAFCHKDPTTCMYCGTTDLHFDENPIWFDAGSETIDLWHDGYGDGLYYVDDGDQHRIRCDNCEVDYAERHSFHCTEQTCLYCDAPVRPDEAAHVGDTEHIDLGSTHVWTCAACDYQSEPEEHYAWCHWNASVCLVCGSGAVTMHLHEQMEYVDLGTQHQRQCVYCGEGEEPENHVASCDEPGVCPICQLPVTVKEEYLVHDYSWVDIGREGCQYECAACGQVKEGPYGHWVWCDGDACWNCRVGENVYDASDYQVYHPEWRIWTTNLSATQHAIGCEACGASVIENHYAYCDGDGGKTCYGCGGTGLEIPTEYIYHDYNASGICNLCGKNKNAPAALPGDADGNDSVNLNDALAILSGDVADADAADVTGDGKVDEKDALLILQYEAGWNVTLQ